jgi:glycyl-radical enzyme activating protein
LSIKGQIFDIQRGSIHDGPGIRTTVFLKGCPLQCAWCHNPESLENEPEISFQPEKCVGCGFCFRTCAHGGHAMKDGRHELLRANCIRCGACAAECPSQAIEVVGREMTVAAVLTEVMRDQPFYETSGGGMTLSGGEPMSQYAFTRALLQAAHGAQLHTCVETSGYGRKERFLALRPFVDLFLWDYKETDPRRHVQFTGVPADGILANLEALDAAGAAIILRCPVVPGFNDRDDHFAGIARVANGLKHVREIHLEPYHPLGKAKGERLARPSTLPDLFFPDDAVVAQWVQKVQAGTKVLVRKE